MHLTAGRRRLLAALLLTTALVATACGGASATQGPVADGRSSAPAAARQGAPADESAPGAASATPAVPANLVADVDIVTYRVGETANLGNLRVTLDRAAVTAGEAGNVAEAGKRFLLIYLTLENTGKAAQSLSFFSTSVRDVAGRTYFVEPYAGYLSAARPLALVIAPRSRLSGNRGYMLPLNAGDLIWTVQDAGRNRASFAVTTTDLVAQHGP
jgi:hypothetical protein